MTINVAIDCQEATDSCAVTGWAVNTVTFGATQVSTDALLAFSEARDTCALSMQINSGEALNLQQLADTCALKAYALLAINLPIQEVRDTCAISGNSRVQVRLNLQQAADFGAITLISIPNPLPIQTKSAPFTVSVPASTRQYVVPVSRTPALATED